MAIAVGSERTERKFNIQLLVVGGAIAKLLNSAKLLLLFYVEGDGSNKRAATCGGSMCANQSSCLSRCGYVCFGGFLPLLR